MTKGQKFVPAAGTTSLTPPLASVMATVPSGLDVLVNFAAEWIAQETQRANLEARWQRLETQLFAKAKQKGFTADESRAIAEWYHAQRP